MPLTPTHQLLLPQNLLNLIVIYTAVQHFWLFPMSHIFCVNRQWKKVQKCEEILVAFGSFRCFRCLLMALNNHSHKKRPHSHIIRPGYRAKPRKHPQISIILSFSLKLNLHFLLAVFTFCNT